MGVTTPEDGIVIDETVTPVLKLSASVGETILLRLKSTSSPSGVLAVTVSGKGGVVNITFAAVAGSIWQMVAFGQITGRTVIVAPLLFRKVTAGFAMLTVMLL